MKRYILALLLVVLWAAPAGAWEWLGIDSTELIITIAADSTDPESTLVDSAISPVTPVDMFDEFRFFLKVKRDTVFAADTVFIEIHAIDASSTTKSNIDTVVATITLDSLATTLARAGALYELTYTDSTWYGYYYLLAIYKFTLGATAADTAIAGNSYDCWVKTYGYGVPRK